MFACCALKCPYVTGRNGAVDDVVPVTALSEMQKALVVIAIGAGAAVVPHANDSGFWVFTQLTGMDIKTGYRLYTVGALCAGTFAGLLPILRQIFHALHAIHVAGGNRVKRCNIARMPFRAKPLSQRFENKVGAAQSRRRGYGDDRIVRNAGNRCGSGNELGHQKPP